MGKHHLKILPEYFQQVAIGNKTFELRKNDRDFKVGDIIFLEEWDNEYTGRVLELEITYILSNFKGLEEGYVILSVSFIRYINMTIQIQSKLEKTLAGYNKKYYICRTFKHLKL